MQNPTAAATLQENAKDVLAFGPFRLFTSERVLKKGDAIVKLGARAFDILAVLAENAGEIVGHKELLAKVWPGVFVEEVSLRVHIAALRKALDTGEAGSRYLTTVSGRGYCFVAPTSRIAADAPAAAERSFDAAYPLPPRPMRVVGRDETVREICRKVIAERFVAIVGPGGMGKTTVALSVAHDLLEEFRGAVCFVELAPLSDPGLLIGSVVSALGLPVQSEDLFPILIAHLRLKRMLLVLDNSEHLISAVAALTERLIGEAPALHILATSREPLRAKGENVHRLAPLESPPDDPNLTAQHMLGFSAVQLFVERMSTGGRRAELSDADAPIVAKICRRLGGIALAIELAAGRVEAFGIRETAARLDSQFTLRWPGRRSAPPRHQTLSATLDWSYTLLSDAERAVLQRLSAFVGNFSFDAAQTVAAGPDLSDEEVFNAIGGLLMKSLASAETSGPVARYRLLETTRTYAALKLNDAGEQNAVRRRHALYYRDLLQQTADSADSVADRPRATAADIDNVRAALHWALGAEGDLPLGVELAALSAPLWLGAARFVECRDWMAKAAASAKEGEATQQQLAIQMALASSVLFTAGISEEYGITWTKTLNMAVSLGDTAGQLTSYLALWGRAIRAPRYDDALDMAQKCAEVAKTVPDPGPTAMAEWLQGLTKHHLGRYAEARIHYQRAFDTDTEVSRLIQLRQIGYDRKVDMIAVMANLLWQQGFAEQARRWGDRAVAEARQLGFALPFCVAMTWDILNKYLSETDIDAVEHDVVELIEYARTHAVGSYLGYGLSMLGLCQARRGQYDDAAPLVAEGLRLLAETHYGVFHPMVRAHLCEAAIAVRRLADARTLMTLAESEDRNPEHWATPEILRVKGTLALALGNGVAAEEHFSSSLAMARRQGAVGWTLRAATSLGRFWAEQGRAKEALALLAPLYAQFTEGFETIDLHAASRLIGELQSLCG